VATEDVPSEVVETVPSEVVAAEVAAVEEVPAEVPFEEATEELVAPHEARPTSSKLENKAKTGFFMMISF
jgi:hypothetical protein